ncbi:kynureninase [Thermocatellispora tengchongensis]|uniref:Kynureninase n=1 Tax=Thermocatellispora tengchongensis TaxID=1073253 RepID=A0A840PAJ5_9ACTN|nr:hypothetical protein [Thermocatellispora tengchongensis]MBB5135696.1 kynureninase [Thermocatellispora tengchongensis]
MPESQITVLRDLLAAYYRPEGFRLGIVLSGGCAEQVAAAASDVLTAHGQAPARRLARLLPRPGEPAERPEDVAGFLEKYGHEYAVAWLPAPAREADLIAITAAARGSGCAIGWDLTGWDVTGSAVDEARLREWGADFALWRDGERVRVYTRTPLSS